MKKQSGLNSEQLEIINKAKGTKKGVQLAQETGIDPRRISKIFNGERKPTLVEAQQLSRVLELPISNFLSDDRAKELEQISVTVGAGVAAACGGMVGSGIGATLGMLIGSFIVKRRLNKVTKVNEYELDIERITKELKLLSKEERKELIDIIKKCDD